MPKMRMVLLLSGAQFSGAVSKQSADLWTHAGISTSHTLQTRARSSNFDWYICCGKGEIEMKETRKLIETNISYGSAHER
jgi:hypothetical protein